MSTGRRRVVEFRGSRVAATRGRKADGQPSAFTQRKRVREVTHAGAKVDVQKVGFYHCREWLLECWKVPLVRDPQTKALRSPT